MEFGELEVSKLRFSRPGFELRADFRVSPGERVALQGPSGSGKTTLLRLLAGLEEVTGQETELRLGSRLITDVPTHRRGIGFVFQDHALFPHLTVLENVAFGLKMKGVARLERDREAGAWLERVGLASKAHSSVTQLSGGEAQRVALARAWVSRPSLILLDEPFSALDRELRLKLAQEIVALHQKWPAPLLWVSHDETDVAQIATRKLVLRVDGPIRTISSER